LAIFGRGGGFDEDVEVVGHDAEGQHAHLGELLVAAHEFDEVFLLLALQDEVAVHDAGDAVVDGGLAAEVREGLGLRFAEIVGFENVSVPGGEIAGSSHGAKLAERRWDGKGYLNKVPVPLTLGAAHGSRCSCWGYLNKVIKYRSRCR
jgi:hypothetical protein